MILHSMETAPKDGTEILALHETGNTFHPVFWTKGSYSREYWGCRWNKEYCQHSCDFIGWIPYPVSNEVPR